MPSWLSVLTQVFLAMALPYFVIVMVAGARAIRRESGSLRAQEASLGRYSGTHRAMRSLHLYFLIPCLNEERVVGGTLLNLFEQTQADIVVIDDGSTDATSTVAALAARTPDERDRVTVVRRELPQARQGKGAALNAGLQAVIADVRARGRDPKDVVICVMDADGRLSPGAVTGALQEFLDPAVGGVQLVVRIRNRDRLITQLQDVEFWAISATSQFARTTTGTVSLGGNGQFTRLAAVMQLSGDAWTTSLTEDLDLGLRLYALGWKVTTTGAGFVDQQGVDNYRTLLRQRTRWYQGHLTCIRRAPELTRSTKINELALAEAISYLLVPWVLVLPWSILQQCVLVAVLAGSHTGIIAGFSGSLAARGVALGLWYLFSFLPNILIGLTYARRTGAVSVPRALFLGHFMIIYNYLGYAAAWTALVRMMRGRTGWSKTPRSREAAVSAVS